MKLTKKFPPPEGKTHKIRYYNRIMMKNTTQKDLTLVITHENSGLIDPYDWRSTNWYIYGNHQMIVEIEGYLNNSTPDQKLQITLSSEDYQKILRLIEEIQHEDREILALDGTIWSIRQFQSGKLIYERPSGHIYGIKPFMALAHLLYDRINLQNPD